MARMGQLPGFACGASFTGTAGVAQSVEQRTRNAKVAGSIPVSGTISKAIRSMPGGFFRFWRCARHIDVRKWREPVKARCYSAAHDHR